MTVRTIRCRHGLTRIEIKHRREFANAVLAGICVPILSFAALIALLYAL